MDEKGYYRLRPPTTHGGAWAGDFAVFGPTAIDALDFVTSSYRVPGMTLKRILAIYSHMPSDMRAFSQEDIEFVWSYLHDKGYLVPLTEEEIRKLPKIKGMVIMAEAIDDPIDDDTPIEWADDIDIGKGN